MNDNTRQPAIQDRFAGVFKRLRDQDIEQFYANYQLWVMRQRVPILEQEIATLRTHLAEHQQQIQALRPSAIALAVLARLQSNGVRDVILLDQMLERGEDWLDRMMQRLDYCEQVEDFIQGDYTQWCVNSLDGAYDWIDSLRGSPEEENTDSSTADAPDEAEAQATAELLLQRLSTDDEETFQNSSLRPSQAETETAAAPGVENVESPTPTSGEIAHVEASSVEAELSTLETVQTASPASESTGEQVTPWYALPLTEDESFDFEHPASMHDWIKILQADSPATPETTETAEPEAAGAESLFHPVSNAHTEDTPYPEEAPIYQDALEAREEISFDSEYQPSETEAVESNELASIPTQDIEEARGQEELPGVPETKAELDTEELAPTMPEPAEIASGQDAAEIADELTTHEQAELMQEMPSFAETSEVPELAEKIENTASEAVEVSIASVSEEEASDEVARLSPVKEEVISESEQPGEVPNGEIVLENIQIAVPEEPVEEQTATSEWTQAADETLSAEPEQVPNEDESVEVSEAEELSQAESEGRNEELPPDPEHEITEQAEHMASTHIALEPEEGQLPWYEYLALEKADNILSENESAEGNGSIADYTTATIPPTSQDESAEDDMTQPFVRKEIQAMQDRPAPADILLANISNSEDATVNAHTPPVEEVASASSEHEERERQREEASVSVETGERVEEIRIPVETVETGETSGGEEVSAQHNVTYEPEYRQAQNSTEEAIATPSITHQKKRQKVSFWQWLFRRKRKK